MLYLNVMSLCLWERGIRNVKLCSFYSYFYKENMLFTTCALKFPSNSLLVFQNVAVMYKEVLHMVM